MQKKIALIDAKSLSTAAEDPRSVALSYGSRQLIEQIHGWPITATPIQEIHISRRGSFGRTLIEAAEYRLPALGYARSWPVRLVASLRVSPRENRRHCPRLCGFQCLGVGSWLGSLPLFVDVR